MADKFQIKKVMSTSVFRLLFIVIIVILPINILTLMLSNITINEVVNQVSKDNQNALELYMNQIDGALRRITLKMSYTAGGNADFIRLNVKEVDSTEEYYNQVQSAVNLKNEFDSILTDHEWMTGIYGYFPDKEMSFICSIVENDSSRKLIEAYVEEYAPNEEMLRQWHIIRLDGRDFLVYISAHKQGYYGAWLDLRQLSSKMELVENAQDSILAFTDTKGAVYYSNQDELEWVDLNDTAKSYDGKRSILVDSESQYADMHLVQILSRNEISNSLPSMLRIMQIGSIAALCIIPVIIIALKKWMIGPLNKLSAAMEKIEQGDMEVRIEERSSGTEFEQINKNFNHMMDEVSHLKIDVYEEQIKNQEIKMRFLSRQVQPHFILNAMNILYSYEQDEYPLIQKMILCLSRYFRYVVKVNVEQIELSQEMDHIRNYFEIQQVRYPKTFFAMVEYEDELADCLVPPLLIQNFAENAIKHSLDIGNRIDIFVVAQKLNDEYMRIRILDTGEGISEALIDKVNIFRKTREYQRELGVGIQNAIERLDILYKEEAGIKIYRVQPHGTQVEILIPLQRKGSEAEDECDID